MRSETIKDVLERKDIIIHLAGENIMAKRWTENHKKNVRESRINSTRKLVNELALVNNKPVLFISASAVGYYGNSENNVTENSKPGNDFLANLVCDWENEGKRVDQLGIRYTAVRIGIVLDVDGGALQRLLIPFKLFIGGTPGDGTQWVPWIHINDLISIFEYAVDTDKLKGPINGVSPNPVRMKDFTKLIGKVLHRPSYFKVPSFILRLIMGEAASVVLEGAKVIPQKLTDSGYEFKFAELETALKDLLD